MKLFVLKITNTEATYGGVQTLRQVVLFVFVPFDKNTLGDIIAVRDQNGNVVAEYDYDAWGNITYQSGSMAEINPFRYRGYYYDVETGFYYLQTRYYDPTGFASFNLGSFTLGALLGIEVPEPIEMPTRPTPPIYSTPITGY